MCTYAELGNAWERRGVYNPLDLVSGSTLRCATWSGLISPFVSSSVKWGSHSLLDRKVMMVSKNKQLVSVLRTLGTSFSEAYITRVKEERALDYLLWHENSKCHFLRVFKLGVHLSEKFKKGIPALEGGWSG